jgi:hypothetical protein
MRIRLQALLWRQGAIGKKHQRQGCIRALLNKFAVGMNSAIMD